FADILLCFSSSFAAALLALYSFPTRRSSDLELHEDASDVGLDRRLGEEELLSDLGVAQPLGDEHEHFCLARGQRLQTAGRGLVRSEEHTSELQSRFDLVCRLLLEKKKILPMI